MLNNYNNNKAIRRKIKHNDYLIQGFDFLLWPYNKMGMYFINTNNKLATEARPN